MKGCAGAATFLNLLLSYAAVFFYGENVRRASGIFCARKNPEAHGKGFIMKSKMRFQRGSRHFSMLKEAEIQREKKRGSGVPIATAICNAKLATGGGDWVPDGSAFFLPILKRGAARC
ncbi:MAG: hypothetical protein II932_02540 [Treponema sp.]|nr:hypothetical protein [Treponema sp.]